MCTYVLATLPSSAALGRLEAAATQHGLNLVGFANRHLTEQLNDGELLVTTTRGHCDCGTPLGRTREHDRAREEQRLAKKGWSQAKIKRWVDDREKAETRRQARHDDQTASVAEWVAFLRLAVSSVGQVGVLHHWFSGDLSTEAVTIHRREKARVADVDEAYLFAMLPDVLYDVHP